MGFGIIILFLLINSSLAYYQLHHINKLNNVLFEDRVYKLSQVNKMASVASTVAENTELIANAFQEQTATIQEISAVAKSLSDGATTLQEEINKFKV